MVGAGSVGPRIAPTRKFRGRDPTIQQFLNLTLLPNHFGVSDGLNTAGYTFQGPEEERQVDFTVRIDHNFNSKNSIFGRWSHGHQNTSPREEFHNWR